MAHGCAIHLYDTSAYDAQIRVVSQIAQKSGVSAKPYIRPASAASVLPSKRKVARPLQRSMIALPGEQFPTTLLSSLPPM